MVGSFILYYAGSRNTAMERSIRRRREWRARGSAAASPESKSPHQQWIRRPRQSDIESYVIPRGRRTKEYPAAWPSGRKVPRSAKDLEEDAVSAWSAGRILPLKEFSLPTRRRLQTVQEFPHPSIKDLMIDRGCSKHNIEGMRQKSAQNSRGLGERRR